MSETEEPAITVNVNSDEILEEIKEKEEEEILKRDRFLLDLMIHAYDEDVSRNELIDSKNCQMIVLTGTMLTLQATLFTTGLLNEFVYDKIIASSLNFGFLIYLPVH